ncbi:MAG: hypothetical protein A2051_01945 [Desulfovibrionales bacterium GWA2_65_9]|nr:MAG: hypothetical protein A2051_01945 [Desulfovibrionales bacterium GWA2_65_9]
MIRHRCAACGHHINRTDHLFEDSDGTLCAACLARLASGQVSAKGAKPSVSTPPPAWAMLPELTFQRPEQG